MAKDTVHIVCEDGAEHDVTYETTDKGVETVSASGFRRHDGEDFEGTLMAPKGRPAVGYQWFAVGTATDGQTYHFTTAPVVKIDDDEGADVAELAQLRDAVDRIDGLGDPKAVHRLPEVPEAVSPEVERAHEARRAERAPVPHVAERRGEAAAAPKDLAEKSAGVKQSDAQKEASEAPAKAKRDAAKEAQRNDHRAVKQHGE